MYISKVPIKSMDVNLVPFGNFKVIFIHLSKVAIKFVDINLCKGNLKKYSFVYLRSR